MGQNCPKRSICAGSQASPGSERWVQGWCRAVARLTGHRMALPMHGLAWNGVTWPGPAWHGMARHDMAWPRMAQPRSTGHSPRHPELQQQHRSQPCHGQSSHAHVHVPVPIHKHDPPAKRVNTPPQRAPPSPRVCAHAAHMCNPTHEHTHGHACAHVQHAPRPPPTLWRAHGHTHLHPPTCVPVSRCPAGGRGGGHRAVVQTPHLYLAFFSAWFGGVTGEGDVQKP